MHRKWVKLWRRAEDKLIPHAFKWQLFSLLLVKASHTTYKHRNRKTGDTITLAPGQVVVSLRKLSEKLLARPVTSIRRDLVWMAKQKMITLEDMGWATLVTVLNWKLYQNPELAEAAVDAYKDMAELVLDDLQDVMARAGIARTVKGGAEFLKLVTARARDDGATLEQFKAIHRSKTKEWAMTEWESFIRPSTIYGKKHWPEYLAEAEAGNGGGMDGWKPKGKP